MIRLKLGEAAKTVPTKRTASVVFDDVVSTSLRLRWDDTGEDVHSMPLIKFCTDGDIVLYGYVDPEAAAAAGVKLDRRGRWLSNLTPKEDRP